MTIATITQYFARRLAELGYEFFEPDVMWSLSYSQGDGMDFAGIVTKSGANIIYRRLMGEPEGAAAEALAEGGVCIAIDRTQSHYHHYNTMSVLVDWDRDAFGETTFDAFAEAVKDDIRITSQTLESEGYKILQACSPMWYFKSPLWHDMYIDDRSAKARSFVRGEMCVEVIMLENTEFDGYESGDDDEDHKDMIRMVNGELITYDLRVRVLAGGSPVFQETVYGIIDRRDCIRPFAIAREALSETRAALQEKARQLTNFAARFQPRSNPKSRQV